MRPNGYWIVPVLVLGLAGCGGGKSFANKPRPDAPVNLTVYINDHRVSVSPASIGAGEVIFIVTNQASQAVSLSVQATGSPGQSLANTGPINPQSTSEVTVDFRSPGRYQLSAGGGTGTGIQPAPLRIGKARSATQGDLSLP